MPEGLVTKTENTYDAKLYDLLKTYGDIKQRGQETQYELPTFHLMSMENALTRMVKMLGKLPRRGPYSVWTTLQSFIPEVKDKLYARSALASSFTVGLELAKQGRIELKQDAAFRPIYLRAMMERLESSDEGTDSNHQEAAYGAA